MRENTNEKALGQKRLTPSKRGRMNKTVAPLKKKSILLAAALLVCSLLAGLLLTGCIEELGEEVQYNRVKYDVSPDWEKADLIEDETTHLASYIDEKEGTYAVSIDVATSFKSASEAVDAEKAALEGANYTITNWTYNTVMEKNIGDAVYTIYDWEVAYTDGAGDVSSTGSTAYIYQAKDNIMISIMGPSQTTNFDKIVESVEIVRQAKQTF